MEFGVPRRREAGSSNEKFENVAVLTVSEFKGKGTGRTLSLNKKAIEVLGIDFEKEEVLISFSFNKIENTVSIANTTGLEGMSGVRLAKTSKSVSDKSYFEAIKANFGVKVEDAAEFLLTDTKNEFNGKPVLSLSLMTAVDVLGETVNQAAAVIAVEVEAPQVEIDPVAEVEATEIIENNDEAPIEYIAEQIEEQEQAVASEEAVSAEADFFAGFNN
jgi:hypothetical protein